MLNIKVKNLPLLIKHKSPFIQDGFARILISGQSGSGKTFSLHQIVPLLKFEKLYFIVKDPYDSTYQDIISSMKEKDIPYEVLTDISEEDVIRIENDPALSKLVIIDDIMTEKKAVETVLPFFTRGRHHRISVIFIAQNYYNIHKLIRENADMNLIFSLPHRCLMEIAKGLAVREPSRNVLQMLDHCTSRKYGFLTICPNEIPLLKYREGLYNPLRKHIPYDWLPKLTGVEFGNTEPDPIQAPVQPPVQPPEVIHGGDVDIYGILHDFVKIVKQSAIEHVPNMNSGDQQISHDQYINFINTLFPNLTSTQIDYLSDEMEVVKNEVPTVNGKNWVSGIFNGIEAQSHTQGGSSMTPLEEYARILHQFITSNNVEEYGSAMQVFNYLKNLLISHISILSPNNLADLMEHLDNEIAFLDQNDNIHGSLLVTKLRDEFLEHYQQQQIQYATQHGYGIHHEGGSTSYHDVDIFLSFLYNFSLTEDVVSHHDQYVDQWLYKYEMEIGLMDNAKKHYFESLADQMLQSFPNDNASKNFYEEVVSEIITYFYGGAVNPSRKGIDGSEEFSRVRGDRHTEEAERSVIPEVEAYLNSVYQMSMIPTMDANVYARRIDDAYNDFVFAFSNTRNFPYEYFSDQVSFIYDSMNMEAGMRNQPQHFFYNVMERVTRFIIDELL